MSNRGCCAECEYWDKLQLGQGTCWVFPEHVRTDGTFGCGQFFPADSNGKDAP